MRVQEPAVCSSNAAQGGGAVKATKNTKGQEQGIRRLMVMKMMKEIQFHLASDVFFPLLAKPANISYFIGHLNLSGGSSRCQSTREGNQGNSTDMEPYRNSLLVSNWPK